MNLIFFNVYVISALLLLLFMGIDFLRVDITVDDEQGLKAGRILAGTIIILIPVANTVGCVYYFVLYFKKALDIINQDSKF